MSSKRKAPNHPLSQKDIAQAAQVSQAVVSAVLRNDSSKIRYSDKMRDRILKIAAEKNYRFNRGASLLRTRKTQNLGLMLSSAQSYPYIPALFYHGVLRQAASSGYYLNLIYDHIEDSEDIPYHLPRNFSEMQVDGYIVYNTGFLSAALQQRLDEEPIQKVVYVNDDRSLNCIRPDDTTAIRLQLEHALAQGYQRPAFCYRPRRRTGDHYSNALRLSSYSKLIKKHQLEKHLFPVDEPLKDYTSKENLRNFFSQFTKDQRPDVFLCASDETAIHICAAVREIGLRIPEDCGVLGINDETICSLAPVPLTSVRIDWEGMGAEAVRQLVRQVENDEAGDFKRIKSSVSLSVRKSTCR